MKKIKILGCFVLVIVLIVGIGILKNKQDYSYYLAMGDYVSHNQVFNGEKVDSFSSLLGEYLLENKKVKEVNGGYLKNNMTSKSLLEMIEKDSYKVDNSSLAKLIEKSKYITISLGVNDFIKQLKYDSLNDKLIYDEDIINNKIDIFKHNYREILSEIKDLNKDATILLIGSYNIYGDKEMSIKINDAIKEVAIDGAHYVDVGNLDGYLYEVNKLYLNNLGQEEIYKRILKCINVIEN